jgi:hypothetical protein
MGTLILISDSVSFFGWINKLVLLQNHFSDELRKWDLGEDVGENGAGG